METKEIRIDLAKETINFSEISNLHEIEEIRFDNCTEKFEIPLAINEYPNITRLNFSGQSKDSLYETPNNLEQLIHIKHLILWNYCDFTKLKPMTHIEELLTIVKSTETDTKQIVTHFPNLKKIEIWGSHLKEGKLPNEVGNLSLLESLNLVSCGLCDLPDSIVNLKNLRELSLRALPMNSFPEVITQLENLETLEISVTLSELPDSLSNLKKLKKLNLNYSLNGGRMEVTGDQEEKLYLKPIPEVIGKLENLEELYLGVCGVFDISPITSLKKLKKLDLQYSALKNCDGFSNFTALEELNLEASDDLKDLEGLKNLPIKKLNISSNYNKSISIISSLEQLETLNIESCDYIKDLIPIYNHSNLKELKASSEILKNWEKKEEFKNILSINTIIKQLKTEDTIIFEKTITYLSKHVKTNSNDESNPLASYFGVKVKNEEIVFIEVLDSAIQKHLKNLSEETLVTIFEMTFKSVGFDNYNATLLILNEIIARKNIDTQLQIIEKFYQACRYYDGGHRYWGFTVHDELIDTLFAQFTSEALYELLKDASMDMLNNEGGDAMDELFVPAFQNTKDQKVYEKLLNVFLKYRAEARTYFGKEYFENLLQKIKEVSSPELENLILAKKEENKEQEEWITLLENLNEQNLPKVVENLANEIPENFDDDDLYKIINAAKKIKLSEPNLEILFDFIIKKKQIQYLSGVLIAQYHENSPESSINYLKIQSEKGILGKESVLYIAKKIIIELTGLNVSFEKMKIYEDFTVSYCDVSFETIYNIEIETLLDKFFKHDRFSQEDISWVLEKAKTIIEKTKEPKYRGLESNIYLLLSSPKYKKVKQVFYVLYPKVIGIRSQRVLYMNICASIRLNDEPYFDLLYKQVQQYKKIKEVLLAFNLACAFAHFERKDEMLFYIKESIQWGKTKQEFLDDEDFEKYWNDEDFLKAVDKK